MNTHQSTAPATATPKTNQPQPRTIWHGRKLIVLMGAPGSGKSTYAKTHHPDNTISIDQLRPLMHDGEATEKDINRIYNEAHDKIVARLKANKAVVFDSTASHPRSRKRLLTIAAAYKAERHIIIFDARITTCIARQAGRAYPVPERVVRRIHTAVARQHEQAVPGEGWDSITVKQTG